MKRELNIDSDEFDIIASPDDILKRNVSINYLSISKYIFSYFHNPKFVKKSLMKIEVEVRRVL